MSNIVIVGPNEAYGIELAHTIRRSVPPPILFQVTTNQADAVKLRKPQENQAYIISQHFYRNPKSGVLDSRVFQLAQDLNDGSLSYDRMMVILDTDYQNRRFLDIARRVGLSKFYTENGEFKDGIAPVSELPKSLIEILREQ